MFTGLVEDVGTIVAAQQRAGSMRLSVRTALPSDSFAMGDSVSVDGACLTVVERAGDVLGFDAGPETLERTIAGEYAAGTRVNLERALQVGARLGGHFVLGHVDAVGRLAAIEPRGDAIDLEIAAPETVLELAPPKGSITLNGTSLTVNTTGPTSFRVSLIPHTWEHTALRTLRVGQRVNLESDVLARTLQWILDRRAAASTPGSGISEEFLRKAGFL